MSQKSTLLKKGDIINYAYGRETRQNTIKEFIYGVGGTGIKLENGNVIKVDDVKSLVKNDGAIVSKKYLEFPVQNLKEKEEAEKNRKLKEIEDNNRKTEEERRKKQKEADDKKALDTKDLDKKRRETERIEKERIEKERIERERIERERIERERREAEKNKKNKNKNLDNDIIQCVIYCDTILSCTYTIAEMYKVSSPQTRDLILPHVKRISEDLKTVTYYLDFDSKSFTLTSDTPPPKVYKFDWNNGLIGYQNHTGNLCFYNAAWQCLTFTMPFVFKLLQERIPKVYTYYANDGTPMQASNALDLIYDFFREKWCRKTRPTVLTSNALYRCIQNFIPALRDDPNRQHDAAEAISETVDVIYELYKCHNLRSTYGSKRQYPERVSLHSLTATDIDIIEMKNSFIHKRKNFVLKNPTSMFYFPVVEETHLCDSCQTPYGTLTTKSSYNIPIFKDIDLQAYFNSPKRWTHATTHRECPVCHVTGSTQEMNNINIILSPPDILMLKLSRNDNYESMTKFDKIISYPQRLNISRTSLEGVLYNKTQLSDPFPEYSLFASIDHSGNRNAGHYTARVCNWYTNDWFLMNDNHVSTLTSYNQEFNKENTHKKNVCVLLYVKFRMNIDFSNEIKLVNEAINNMSTIS